MSCFVNSILYNVDLFKSPIYLLFNSHKKVPSKFSCLISFCIIVFLIVFFVQSDIFLKQRPVVTAQLLATNTRPLLQFDPNNMAFALGISDDTSILPSDDSYYTVSMINYNYNSSGALISEDEKTLRYCQQYDFQNQGINYNDLGLGNALCPETKNFSLKGYWDEPTTEYIQVMVYPCDNNTSSVTCKSADEISSYFQNKYVNIYYSDTITDATNFEKPIQKIYKTFYFTLDPIITKKLTMNIQQVVLSSDDGLIFENQQITNSFMMGSRDMDVNSIAQKWIACIVLYSSPQSYIVTRRYQRIQEAIANLGGLANAMLLVGFLLTSIEKEFIVFSTIINKLYIFSDKKTPDSATNIFKTIKLDNIKVEEKHKITLEVKKPMQTKWNENFIQPIEPNDNFDLEHFSQEIPKEIDPGIKTIYEKKVDKYLPSTKMISRFRSFINQTFKKTKDVSVKFSEFLKIRLGFSCFRFNKKEKLLKQAYRIYKKEIDIVELIQKVQEIDKLKLLLLNTEQCKMFNLIAKPLIQVEGKNKNKLSDSENEISSSRKVSFKLREAMENVTQEKLQAYYIKVKNEGQNANPIDQRLIKMMDLKLY